MDPRAGWTGGFLQSFAPYIAITAAAIGIPVIIGILLWKKIKKK